MSGEIMCSKISTSKLKPILDLFASFYVRPNLRERFIHEAIKYPKKLDRRIRSGELFDDNLLGKPTHFPDSGLYLRFSPQGFYTFSCKYFDDYGVDIKGDLWIDSGELIISSDGRWFWSATETYPTKYYHRARPFE